MNDLMLNECLYLFQHRLLIINMVYCTHFLFIRTHFESWKLLDMINDKKSYDWGLLIFCIKKIPKLQVYCKPLRFCYWTSWRFFGFENLKLGDSLKNMQVDEGSYGMLPSIGSICVYRVIPKNSLLLLWAVLWRLFDVVLK